jgi:hypothetical protein
MGVQCKRSQFEVVKMESKIKEYDFTIYYRSGKSISHADFLSRMHKADSNEGGKKCQECIGHQQGHRASDEGKSPDVRQQAEGASDEKMRQPPPKKAKTKVIYLSLRN